MKKIACMGEFLLRMSPEMPGTWIRESTMPVYLGGAEFNVSVALSTWENPVKYISALPDNSLSADILSEMRLLGIDTSAMQQSGNRIGIYLLPQGADLKNAGVIYDRAGSSFAELKPGTINWKELLGDCSFFHFSAISPALSRQTADLCLEAVEAAAELGISISVDLNYRSKLWKYGVEPVEIMPKLIQHCQLVMGNIWSAASLLGAPIDEDIHAKESKQAYLDHASLTANYIRSISPACKWVANTFRFDTENGIRYYASIDTASQQFVSREFQIRETVDRVGSGDCFMAGLIHGWQNRMNEQDAVNFAATAATGKLQEKGDYTRQTVTSIQEKISAHV